MQKQARITSKGQITVPIEIRQVLGVKSGDRLMFESDGKGIRVRPVRTKSAFSKYRGIGNPGIRGGRKGITRWLRDLRGAAPNEK
jgi:AbrB family looped-hinge helix DNA binding protein